MNLRLAASVVFVVTLAYACGPRSRTDAAVDLPKGSSKFALASMGGASPSMNSHERIGKKETATLTTKFDVTQQGTDVKLSLRVVNSTGKSVEITFASGQAYDFTVVDSVGREVWNWADGRVFTQSVQNKLLGKGEGISIAEKWSPAKPGKFTAIAILRSTNFPVQQRVEFERK